MRMLNRFIVPRPMSLISYAVIVLQVFGNMRISGGILSLEKGGDSQLFILISSLGQVNKHSTYIDILFSHVYVLLPNS